MITHRVTIQGLEVQVVVCDADVARVGHQRGHHLCFTLHMWPLGHTLKATHTHTHVTLQYQPMSAAVKQGNQRTLMYKMQTKSL